MRRIELIIALSLIFVCATQAEDFTIGNNSYTITSQTTVKLEKVLDASGDVVVEDHVSYKGYEFQVTALGNNCFSQTNVRSVTIPESITVLEGGIFSGCIYLEEVFLPEGIEKITYNMFRNCERLTSITLPSSVKAIEDYAFMGCALTKIELHEGITDIGTEAFRSSTALESVVIKGSPDMSAERIFSHCTALKDVRFEQPVSSIGVEVFSGCTELRNINLPEGLTKLDVGCFNGCSSLTEITLPESLSDLAIGCFGGCSALQEITIPDGIETIPTSLLADCTSLKKVTLPCSTTKIEDCTFQNCTSLEDITIPENVFQIGSRVFNGCQSLRRITFRNTQVGHLEGDAFDSDHFSLAQVTIPVGAKERYSAKESWNRFANMEEKDLGANYNNATIYVAKHGSIQYEGKTIVGDTQAENANRKYVISYEEGKDAYFTILPEENYDFSVSINNIQVGPWRESETYIKGNEVHFGDGSRPTDIVVNFGDLLSIITIRQGTGGCFQLKAQRNHQYQYRANPIDGWQVHSITYNGVDMTSQMDERLTILTPPLADDATINIAFEKIGTNLPSTEQLSRIHVYGTDGILHIEQAAGKRIRVYTIDGSLVGTWEPQVNSLQIPLPRNKVYIVSSNDQSIKIWL